MAMVAMQLPLPHPAVLTGVWCRMWQVRRVGVQGICHWLGQLPAVVRQLHGCWAEYESTLTRPLACSPLPLLQAGVLGLSACMLYVLRSRISSRVVLPSSDATAPKNL